MIEKPKKKDLEFNSTIEEKERMVWNAACAEWEKWHEQQVNKMTEDKLLEICWGFLNTVTIAGEGEPNIPHQQVIFKKDIPDLVKAIHDLLEGKEEK